MIPPSLFLSAAEICRHNRRDDSFFDSLSSLFSSCSSRMSSNTSCASASSSACRFFFVQLLQVLLQFRTRDFLVVVGIQPLKLFENLVPCDFAVVTGIDFEKDILYGRLCAAAAPAEVILMSALHHAPVDPPHLHMPHVFTAGTQAKGSCRVLISIVPKGRSSFTIIRLGLGLRDLLLIPGFRVGVLSPHRELHPDNHRAASACESESLPCQHSCRLH